VLRVEPRSYMQVREWLARLGVEDAPFLPSRDAGLPDDHPVLHVPYREVPDAIVARVFGFSGISEADAPLGLASVDTPGSWPAPGAHSGILLFPLAAFSEHLRACAASREQDLGASGVDPNEDEELSFVAAVRGVADYCSTHDCALTIRW
jgi:hypothetical protein